MLVSGATTYKLLECMHRANYNTSHGHYFCPAMHPVGPHVKCVTFCLLVSATIKRHIKNKTVHYVTRICVLLCPDKYEQLFQAGSHKYDTRILETKIPPIFL